MYTVDTLVDTTPTVVEKEPTILQTAYLINKLSTAGQYDEGEIPYPYTFQPLKETVWKKSNTPRPEHEQRQVLLPPDLDADTLVEITVPSGRAYYRRLPQEHMEQAIKSFKHQFEKTNSGDTIFVELVSPKEKETLINPKIVKPQYST